MGLKKIKCRVKAGRGDGPQHKWDNFIESSYDEFKTTFDAADQETKDEIIKNFNISNKFLSLNI